MSKGKKKGKKRPQSIYVVFQDDGSIDYCTEDLEAIEDGAKAATYTLGSVGEVTKVTSYIEEKLI